MSRTYSDERKFIELLIITIPLANQFQGIFQIFVNSFSCYSLSITLTNPIIQIYYSFTILFISCEQNLSTSFLAILLQIFNLIIGPILLQKACNLIFNSFKGYIFAIKKHFQSNLKKQNLIFASMTHDLRNPLSAQINTIDDISEASNLNSRQKEDLKIASFSAKLQLNLINNILDFSKIENGKFELNFIPINIINIINLVLNIEEQLASKKGLYIRTKIISMPPDYVLSDPNRISQILMNLIGNAIKFTNKGGIDIKIEWISDPKEFIVNFKFEEQRKRKRNSDCKIVYSVSSADQFNPKDFEEYKYNERLSNLLPSIKIYDYNCNI